VLLFCVPVFTLLPIPLAVALPEPLDAEPPVAVLLPEFFTAPPVAFPPADVLVLVGLSVERLSPSEIPLTVGPATPVDELEPPAPPVAFAFELPEPLTFDVDAPVVEELDDVGELIGTEFSMPLTLTA
jgi:hypothetical protein